jgi:hypothetical protein
LLEFVPFFAEHAIIQSVGTLLGLDTTKLLSKYYDACWDVVGVKVEKLDEVLLSFTDEGKHAMREKYRGDIRPDSCSPAEKDCTYLEFFQMGRDGEPKGIVKLLLAEFKP